MPIFKRRSFITLTQILKSGSKSLKLCLLLSSIILGGLSFQSCTKKNDGRTDITIWTNKRPEERQTLQQLIERYVQKDHTVRITQQYFETEELRDKFINSVIGKKGPEIMYGPSDPIGPLVTMDTLRPFDGLLSSDLKKNLVADAFVEFNGKIYQVAPTIGNHLMLIYNKKLVKKVPQTFDELLSMSKEFAKDTDGNGELNQFGLVWNYIEPYFMVPFLTGAGGWVMDEQNNPTLNTPAMVAALRFILDLRNKYKIVPLECDYETAEALFKEGKAMFIINGPWALSGYLQANIEFGVGRIPKLPGQTKWPAPMKSPLGYSINKWVSAEKLPAVVKLVEFLVSEQAQLLSFERDRNLPTQKSVIASKTLKKDNLVQKIIDQRDIGRTMPVHPNMRVLWDQMRPPYQKTLLGKTTPEEAAAEMQRNALSAIARMKRE